ncbi:MAG: histidinol-phosphate transaminase [Thermogutta sp.]
MVQSFFRRNVLKMGGYVPGEQPQEGGYVKLNTNENPYPPSPRVAEAIGEVLRRGIQKYPDPLASSFRETAGRVLGVDSEWILAGNGSDDILTIVTRAFVGEGDLVRYPYPSYLLYGVLAQLQNAQSESIVFENDWSLGAAFWQARDRLKLIYLANPNSPSGTMLGRDVLKNWLKQAPCPVLIDEAYVDFADESCLALVRENERVMISRTLSKSYALAGLRFGFLIAQPQIIRELRKVKDSYNCDALAIAGACAALSDQEWLRQTRAKILATRERLTKELQDLGFDVLPSQANFVWCSRTDRQSREIYETLKTYKVLVRYMNYPGWGDGLRITVGTDAEIDVLLETLRKIL